MRRFVKHLSYKVVVSLPVWLFMASSAWAVTLRAINGTPQVTVNGWQFSSVPNADFYFIQARAAFDGGPFSNFVDSKSFRKLLTSNPMTPQILGPAPGMPFGQGKIDHTGTVGFLRISYQYTLTAIAQAGTPPPTPRTTITEARYVDPTSLIIGPQNTNVDLSQLIRAGTQLQGFQAGQEPFSLVFEGRFADSALDNPAFLWPSDDSVPSEAFNLYRIEVFENVSGSIEASVQLFSSPNPDFGLTFSLSAQQIESAIETAGWVRDSSGFFVLPQDLSLLTASVINLNPSRSGDTAVIGTRTTVPSFEANVGVPEPSTTITLLSFGGFGLLGIGWRRCKEN